MKKKKETPRRAPLSLQDLKKAEMDPVLKYRVQQKSSVKGIITGQDKMAIRKFARKTWSVAKQRNPDITIPQLMNNLTKVLEQVKPDIRKIMLEKLHAYVK